jgi:hypothetical protein
MITEEKPVNTGEVKECLAASVDAEASIYASARTP